MTTKESGFVSPGKQGFSEREIANMRPSILCRERLLRIQRVLNRAGGKMCLRNLTRSFAIWPWEVEQAAALGWLKVYVQACSGGRGRPSRVVELITQDQLANLPLPPARDQIPREISARHQLFAIRAARECVIRGIKALGFSGMVAAYIKTYNPRSYAGARASASRLVRHPHVRAAMWKLAGKGGMSPGRVNGAAQGTGS